MGILREIVFDCVHPAGLARFWVEVLDEFEIRPYEADEVARLAAQGLTPETDTSVMVDGPGLNLCFQKTATRTTLKNPVHLDVAVAARADVVRRVCALGAAVVEDFDKHTWMRDPEGHDFCLTDLA